MNENICGFDLGCDDFNCEVEGYYDESGVFCIVNVFRWNKTIEHEEITK